MLVAKEYPKTMLEFEHWFRSEQACRDYLIQVRWPDGFRCPRCGHGQAWRTRRGFLHCGGCRNDISPKVGTLFESTRMPLRLWFRAMWLVTHQKGGVSALGLQRALGLGSYRTAWACLHKLRRAMVRPGREPLTEEVEVDETLVGGRGKGQKTAGRHVGKKSLVMIAAEVRGKAIGRIRLRAIPNTSKEHLLDFVRQTVALGATVMTDGLPVYMNLAGKGYSYLPRPNPPGRHEKSNALPRVHRVAALLKRWLLGIHHGSFTKRQLPYYLDEFTFRFNRRGSPHRGMLFYRLLQQAVQVAPTPIDDLKQGA